MKKYLVYVDYQMKADSIFTPKKFRKTRTFGVIFQQSVKMHFEKFLKIFFVVVDL